MKHNTLGKILSAVCALALATAILGAFAACDDGGTKYTYKDCTVTSSTTTTIPDYPNTDNTLNESLKTMYNTMYQGAKLSVSDKKITMTLQDQKSTMTVNMDGDKYVLSGDYVETIKQAMEQGLSFDMNVGTGDDTATGSSDTKIDFEMYGIKTETGFDLVSVIEETTTTAYNGETAYTITTTSNVILHFE